MGTLNPDQELNEWKQSIAAGIEISCKSHYGPEALLPTFPWFMDSGNSDVTLQLDLLAKTSKRKVKAFSTQVADFLEKTHREVTDKSQSLLVNRMDVVSIEQKLHSLTNPKIGASHVSVKAVGSAKTLTIISRTQSTGKNPKVELNVEVLKVKFKSDDVYVGVPRAILQKLTLEQLSLPAVVFQHKTKLDGEEVMLEFSLQVSESDQLDLLTNQLASLEDIKTNIEADIKKGRALIDGIMEALDIKEEAKVSSSKERYCEYCVLI